MLVLCIGLAFIPIYSHHYFFRSSTFYDRGEDVVFDLATTGSSTTVAIEHAIANNQESDNDAKILDHDAITSKRSMLLLEDRVHQPHISITTDEVMRLLKRMQDGKVADKGFFIVLLEESKKLLHSLKNVYHISHPANKEGNLLNSTVTVR
jgi:hypothetical protein